MKFLIYIIIASTLVACAGLQQNEHEYPFNPPNDYRARAAVAGEHINVTNDLACRADDDVQVKYLLEKAKKHNGVVLYFHGGLSDRAYMENSLGPWLNETLFAKGKLPGLFPIIVNYDAHPFKDGNWPELLKNLSRIKAYKAALEHVKSYVSTHDKKNLEGEALAIDARNRLYAAMGKKLNSSNKSDPSTLPVSEADIKLLLPLLKNDKNDELNKGASKSEREMLINIGEKLSVNIDVKNSDDRFQETIDTLKSDKVAIFSLKAGVVAARALVRFATSTNHGFIPTIEEEFYRELDIIGFLNIKEFAAAHWRLVKGNAFECVRNHSGEALINGLLAIQKSKNSKFTINALSHSAGSITVARLIEKMANENEKLSSVVMVVPAINQKDFTGMVINNKKGFKNLALYVLDKNRELGDTTGRFFIKGKSISAYHASLLYFVSGAADNKWYGDSMLLLKQHLKKNRWPYRTAVFRKLTGERPDKIWEFFDDNKNTVSLNFYPSTVENGDGTHEPKGPSHECTKYPWATLDLARRVAADLTGQDASTLKLEPPDNFSPNTRNCH